MKDKYVRRRRIIEHLSQQIYLLNERAFKEYPNWEEDEKDTDYLFWMAKQALNSGLYFSIEHVCMGGIAGSQVITQGTIRSSGKYNVDYNNVLKKAVLRVYERQKKTIPNREEQKRIINQHFNELDNPEYKTQFNDLRDKFSNFDMELIRNRLRDKLDNYLRGKLSQ